jgi:comEA protein
MSNATTPRLATVASAKGHFGGAVTRRLLLASLAVLIILSGGVASASSGDASLAGVVNLNTASIEELKLLPGVGEARAAAIVTMRNELGGFTSVDELMEVRGVGPNMMKRLRPHITLEGETTAATR